MEPLPRHLVIVASLCALSSCAVGTTSNPPTSSMSAARAGLRPEYRLFYDTLAEYGDWVLIEPYGYVFRPRVGFADWRPYQYGFWAPTDAYGWVWISNEPFGWATFHYGRWFFDEYNAWVWQPGIQWAPAWVSWRANDQYVGWSPLLGGGGGQVPGGAYLFTTVDALGSTDLTAKVTTQAELGSVVANTSPVNEEVELDGVAVPAGPPVSLIERRLGQRLPRAQVDDLLPRRGVLGREPRSETAAPADSMPTVEELRRAGEQASREARTLSTRGGRIPPRLPMVRPPVGRGFAPRRGVPAPAAKDTSAAPGG